MPLPVADPKLAPIVFLNTDLFGSPANIQALLALHIEFYPYYVVVNTNNLSRARAVDALTEDGLAFVADSLHRTWSAVTDVGSMRDTWVAAWARQLPSPREPFSFLIIDDAKKRAATAGSHLADYSVFCDAVNGFDDSTLEEARLILRSQIPVIGKR